MNHIDESEGFISKKVKSQVAQPPSKKFPRIKQNFRIIILGLVIVSYYVAAGILVSNDQKNESRGEIRNPATGNDQSDGVEDQHEVKIELKYVSPPDYEEFGRGLVYNCKGKHWACISKDAYLTCRNNMKWNTGHYKDQECMTINVYATDEDCYLIQRYNVNTRQKTDFCNQ